MSHRISRRRALGMLATAAGMAGAATAGGTRILFAGDDDRAAPLLDGRVIAVGIPGASALGGAVQLYTAQSPAFLNGFYNPAAVTADQASVSNPLDLSINNAFGRLWPANAPFGLDGPGTSTIDDPDGRPLKGAPNTTTGGVYFDGLTGRQPAQVI